jgi:citrate synthase
MTISTHHNAPPKIPELSWEENWQTSLGAWFPGERVMFRGQDLLAELADLPWMGLLLYGITGRRPSQAQIRLFDSLWALAASFPDPRLWNNRIGALAGSARSTTTLGVSAGIAVSEAIIYGYQPLMAAMESLLDIAAKVESGQELSQILHEKLTDQGQDLAKPGRGKNRCVARLPGYGRPIAARDERIAPLMKLTRELGFDKGPMLTLAFEIEAVLKAQGNAMQMNVVGLMAGLSADQGLSPREHYQYGVLCFSAGILHCAVDAAKHPQGSFFPLRCSRINYQGPNERRWQKIDF